LESYRALEILYLLVPIAVIFIALAIKLLFWAIKNGQYEDLDTEASRILFEQKNSKAKAQDKSATDS
jgi:cbb3-type cytochrome oxidase maturation protein